MVREPGGEIVEDGRVTSARFMASKSSSAPHCLAKARSSFLVAALFATLCALMYTSHSPSSITPLPSVSISVSCMRSTAEEERTWAGLGLGLGFGLGLGLGLRLGLGVRITTRN